jgi:hypothetical protein
MDDEIKSKLINLGVGFVAGIVLGLGILKATGAQIKEGPKPQSTK